MNELRGGISLVELVYGRYDVIPLYVHEFENCQKPLSTLFMFALRRERVKLSTRASVETIVFQFNSLTLSRLINDVSRRKLCFLTDEPFLFFNSIC